MQAGRARKKLAERRGQPDCCNNTHVLDLVDLCTGTTGTSTCHVDLARLDSILIKRGERGWIKDKLLAILKTIKPEEMSLLL